MSHEYTKHEDADKLAQFFEHCASSDETPTITECECGTVELSVGKFSVMVSKENFPIFKPDYQYDNCNHCVNGW